MEGEQYPSNDFIVKKKKKKIHKIQLECLCLCIGVQRPGVFSPAGSC